MKKKNVSQLEKGRRKKECQLYIFLLRRRLHESEVRLRVRFHCCVSSLHLSCKRRLKVAFFTRLVKSLHDFVTAVISISYKSLQGLDCH